MCAPLQSNPAVTDVDKLAGLTLRRFHGVSLQGLLIYVCRLCVICMNLNDNAVSSAEVERRVFLCLGQLSLPPARRSSRSRLAYNGPENLRPDLLGSSGKSVQRVSFKSPSRTHPRRIRRFELSKCYARQGSPARGTGSSTRGRPESTPSSAHLLACAAVGYQRPGFVYEVAPVPVMYSENRINYDLVQQEERYFAKHSTIEYACSPTKSLHRQKIMYF